MWAKRSNESTDITLVSSFATISLISTGLILSLAYVSGQDVGSARMNSSAEACVSCKNK